MSLNLSWSALLVATLTFAGVAKAGETEDDKSQHESHQVTEEEAFRKELRARIAMCGLYVGHQSSPAPDAILTRVCEGQISLKDLKHDEIKKLKTEIKDLADIIGKTSNGHVI